MAGAVVGMIVSSFVAEVVAAEVIIGGLFLDSVFLIEGATMIGAGVGALAGGLASSTVNGALAGDPATVNPQPSAVSSARAQGMLINAASNVEPVPVLYGSRRMGGGFALEEVSSENNEYFHLVVSICEGEIDGFNQVYLDDVPYTDARFAGLVGLETYVGTDTQAASAALVAALPGVWSANDTGSGTAYLYLRLTYSQDAFHGRPLITADVRGKKLYDPRTGLTLWSDNPALAIRDYLTNTRYGWGLAASAIDDAAIIVAANHCDELVAIPGGTQKRYIIDGAVDINGTLLDNLKLLLTSCRGMLRFSGGQYKLIIDKAETPSAVFAFTEDNITGDWGFSKPGRRATFNRVTASFFNRDAQWQPDFAPWESTAYRTQDGGLLLEDKINLPYTANMYRAMQLAGLHGKQSRFGIAARFSAFQEGLRCEVGDVVPITHSTPGWVNKPFRVMQIDIKSDDEVDVVVREYDASAYALDTLAVVTGGPATNLPDPFTVAAPGVPTLSSGADQILRMADGALVSRIKVTLPAPADAYVRYKEFRWKKSADAIWQAVSALPIAPLDTWLAPAEDGATYDVAVRYENSIGVRGAWTQAAPHTVIGKSAKPGAMPWATLSDGILRWGLTTEQDLDGAIWRWQPGTNKSWGDANSLHDGLVQQPYELKNKPLGQVTLLGKLVDVVGNESVDAAVVVTDFGDPLIANVIYTKDCHAAGFIGTRTNATVDGGTGDLIADAETLPAMWANPVAAFWSTPSAPMWDTTTYKPMQYVDAIDIAAAAAGSQITVTSAIAAGSYTLDYRRVGAAPMWADPLNPMWSAPADPMWTSEDWQVWPGAIAAEAVRSYEFRVTTSADVTRGRIAALLLQLDVPDITESFYNIALAAGGTRLPIVNVYRAIKGVHLTQQADAGTSRRLAVIDKDATLGPLCQGFDVVNAGAAAHADATIQGY